MEVSVFIINWVLYPPIDAVWFLTKTFFIIFSSFFVIDLLVLAYSIAMGINQTCEKRPQTPQNKTEQKADGTSTPREKSFNLNLAPVDLPFERRLQTLCSMLLWNFMPFAHIVNVCCILSPQQWWWYIPYLTWCLTDRAPWRGGRSKHPWFFKQMMKRIGDYFPVTVVKDGDFDLPADKSYMFGYHPHGIIGIGLVLTSGSGVLFHKIFPNLDIQTITINWNMRLPFMRDWALSQGFISADKESISYKLSKGNGQTLCAAVGGAAEAPLTRKGGHDLVLNRRKGFFKIALQHGAHVCPIYGFGENDAFNGLEIDPKSVLGKVSAFSTKYLGFSMPTFHGRGVFQYTFGLMPYRRPIHVVVGQPIPVKKIEAPTDDDISALQKVYGEHLMALFNKYKGKYCTDPDNEFMRFVQ